MRLYGIDAPESDQPFGRESTRALQQMVRSRPLALDVFAHDQYGRAIGLLYPRGGDPRQSLNVAMVREGWAYCYHRKGRYSHGLDAAQRQARAAGRGIWAQETVERPWTYRRRMREDRGALAISPRLLLAMAASLVVLYVLARVIGGG